MTGWYRSRLWIFPRKGRKMTAESITITTEYIKLDQFLKFAGVVGSGAEAKLLIGDGLVTVNGEICTMRGKKLRPGDTVVFDDELSFTICN